MVFGQNQLRTTLDFFETLETYCHLKMHSFFWKILIFEADDFYSAVFQGNSMQILKCWSRVYKESRNPERKK